MGCLPVAAPCTDAEGEEVIDEPRALVVGDVPEGILQLPGEGFHHVVRWGAHLRCRSEPIPVAAHLRVNDGLQRERGCRPECRGPASEEAEDEDEDEDEVSLLLFWC